MKKINSPSKIREILEKYTTREVGYNYRTGNSEDAILRTNLDKLEKELQELMTNAVNRQYKNALKKIKSEGIDYDQD